MLLNEGAQVYLATSAIDMRKNIDSLSIWVSEQFALNPSCGSLFVFYNQRRDKIKVLYFDRNGFVLLYKRLEKGKFILPVMQGTLCVIEPLQLQNLLAGLDIGNIHLPQRLHYRHFA
jgi:transposase